MQNQEEKWLLEEKYKGTKSEAFHADLELLKYGTPLGYLIGSIPFLDCTIYLDSHPLIPRTETEFWTDKAIHEIITCRGLTPTFTVLDLCAGSGAIGTAVAKKVPSAQVDFVEIDPAHLPTIQKNIKSNLSKPFDISKGLIISDLFENIKGKKYDFILTNPPYIDPEIDRAEASVKLHEPHLALYGGKNGMKCITNIIKDAPEHLTDHGQLWIEHEPEQTDTITSLAMKNGFICSTHNDQYGIERYSILMLQ